MSIATFPAGSAYSLPLQITQMDGVTPSTAYLSTDVLTAYLWAGDDQANYDNPAVAWTSCPQYAVNFVLADTQNYAPGVYRLVVTATRSGSTVEVLRDSIELTFPAPTIVVPAVVTATSGGVGITALTLVNGGSGYPASSTTIPVQINGGFNGGYSAYALATSNASGVITAVNLLKSGTGYTGTITVTVGAQPPLVYCTLEDMQALCSWIQQYQDQDRDEAGFLQQRSKARTWLDSLMLASWPGARVTYIQDGWPSNYGQFTLIANPWLVAGLDQGYLLTALNTPQNVGAYPRAQQATETAAAYAIALVLRSQMGPTSGIEKYAGYWMRRAQSMAANLTCELDINGDGLVDIAIPLSLTNTRRG